MKYDFTVIGTGISGMASAVILAKSGYRVCLIEKSRKLAPVIRGFKRKGLYFDTGFHYTGSLGDGEVLDLYFKYLGISDRIEKVPLNQQGFDVYRCLEPEFEISFPVGYDQLRERLHVAFPEEKKSIDTYMQKVVDTSNSFPYINLNERSLKQSLSDLHGPSLQDVLDRITDNKLLKATLSIYCLLHGTSPKEISFSVHACVASRLFESVHEIKGGGLALVRAFESVLEDLNVDILCGRGVKELLFSPDQSIAGVGLEDGEILECNGCVSTVHPLNFLEFIPDHMFRPAYRKRLAGLEESSSAFMLYVVLDHPVKQLSGKNIFISETWDIDNFCIHEPIQNRPYYVTSAGHHSHDGENKGYVAICPASVTETDEWSESYTGRRPRSYTRFKEEIAGIMRRHIEKNCPELRGEVVRMECATPLTLRDWTNAPGGLYGVKHKIGQYNPMAVTKSAGLYLAGQAVAAPGVVGAIISAFLACENVTGHDRLRREIAACI